MKLRSRLLIPAIATAAVAVTVVTTLPSASALPKHESAVATAHFHADKQHKRLHGKSVFTEHDNEDGFITVEGSYRGLAKNKYYFTVIYSNTHCDPAEAFPVGSFKTNNHGTATFNLTVRAGASVGDTESMSIRHADTGKDRDHDGEIGPADVVAVPGKPSVGLVECDHRPLVVVR